LGSVFGMEYAGDIHDETLNPKPGTDFWVRNRRIFEKGFLKVQR
jgi:hypothetical protein